VNILIVDDHAPLREALRVCLQLALPQYDIREAEDGRSAWSELRRSLPDLVLMDVNLPDANGIELTAQIKKSLPLVPVVVVTGHSIESCGEDALAAGASAFVMKEAMQRELLPVVMRVLDRAHGTSPRDDDAAAALGDDRAEAGTPGADR